MILKRDDLVLVNEAGNWTPHRYIGSEILTLLDEKQRPQTGIAHLYSCTITNVVRRYGFDALGAHGEKDPNA